MDAHLTCPRGHRWSPAEREAPLPCPQCEAADDVVVAVATASTASPADVRVPQQPTVRLRGGQNFSQSRAPQIDGYEILAEVGRGGMGVVYQARQKMLNRIVALKMILDACRDRPQEHARFLSEAEVIASLHHPNIVQIYEIGEAEGRPFFSLEYVEGGSLAQRLRSGIPLASPQAARLIADVARGVDAAHRQGVVHRDLKPANILLAGKSDSPIAETTPKITDFGLAKKRDGGLKTTAGFILGTPCYMAPEQAAGKVNEVGPASDIYALGAILYELLTGRPPFQGETPLITMQQVISEEPIAPTQIQAQAPVDLETICLKCLQKDPRKRYAGAAALADDLQRFLDGRSIQALPAAAGERLVKWTRRRPATAAFLGVSLVALTLLLAGGVWHTIQLHEALFGAERSRDASVRAQAQAEERERQVREYEYAARVRQAGQCWDHADLRSMRELLGLYAQPGDSDPREFTWRYLHRLTCTDRRTLEGHTSDVYYLAYSPDGSQLATAAKNGDLCVWDAATGRLVFLLQGHTSEANCVAFSPDGATLASVGDDGKIILWDLETGRERRRLQEGGKELATVAWDPAGRLVATAGDDRMIEVWNAGDGAHQFSLTGHTDTVESLAFAPGGRYLVSGAKDATVRVWDLNEIGKHQILPAHTEVFTIAFSRDGRRLAAACGDGVIRLWDAPTWQMRSPIAAHMGEAHGVAFSPDGQVLATGGNDRLIRLWDVETGAPRNSIRGHEERVWSVAFSPDGKTLASAGRDHLVKLWNPELRQDWQALPASGSPVRAVAVDPQGKDLALGQVDGSIQLLGLHDHNQPIVLPAQNESPVVALAYAANGERLAAQTGEGAVILWDVKERNNRVLRGKTALTFRTIALSADGGVLACQAADKSVQLWNATTGELLPSPVEAGKVCTCLALSPAGDLLAVALDDEYEVVLYDLRTGETPKKLTGHWGAIACIAFSADGKTLATGSADQTVNV